MDGDQSLNQINQINQSIDNDLISEGDDFYEHEIHIDQEKSCICNASLNRFCDSIQFVLIFFDAIFCLFSTIFIILEFSFSFYSVILMSYVFFVSSIVSYAMAPIYKIMSGDYINFVLSIAQVILSSPLISFYIFYIYKSVKSLGEFFQDTKQILLKVLNMYRISFRSTMLSFCSGFCECNNYKKIFDKKQVNENIFYFFFDLLVLISFGSSCYCTFFIDKMMPFFGFTYYLFIVFQIILSIILSYIYFFQTLFNIKSKRMKYIKRIKKIYKIFEDSEDKDKSKKEKKTNKSENPELDKQKIFESDSESDELKPSESNESQTEETDKSKVNNCFSLLFQKIYEIILCIYKLIIKVMKISFENKLFKRKKEKKKEEEEEEEDSESSEDLSTEKGVNKRYKMLLKALKEPLIAKDYFSIYYYSSKIAFDRHHQCRKMVTVHFFALFNVVIIVYDIIQLIQDYSDYLFASIIIRIILIPPLSYFNILCTIFYNRAKDKTIRYINYWALVITILIVIAVIGGVCYSFVYRSKYRINNLDYVPPFDNITNSDDDSITHPICDTEILDVSAFDAFGYSLGGFDVKRNKVVFDNQMKTFFGENYSNHISYTVYELDKYFLFLKFFDSSINTTIFAFRGYNSGPEITFQFELFISKYVLPLFEDVAPLLELINDFWISFYTGFFQSFGLRFFENRNLMVKYINSIIKIFHKENYQNNQRVFFTGINTGGVIAKILSGLLQRKSISFLSFPVEMDFVQRRFRFDDSYMNYITNVFQSDGVFSMPDGDHAINIAMDIPSFHQSKHCSSDFCEVFSRFDNIYRTFCTMSEICDKGNQFHEYCKTTIGEKNIEIIRDSLKDSEE